MLYLCLQHRISQGHLEERVCSCVYSMEGNRSKQLKQNLCQSGILHLETLSFTNEGKIKFLKNS